MLLTQLYCATNNYLSSGWHIALSDLDDLEGGLFGTRLLTPLVLALFGTHVANVNTDVLCVNPKLSTKI